MAAAVGSTGRVCGIDPSESMLAIANGRRSAPGGGALEFVRGVAEDYFVSVNRSDGGLVSP